MMYSSTLCDVPGKLIRLGTLTIDYSGSEKTPHTRFTSLNTTWRKALNILDSLKNNIRKQLYSWKTSKSHNYLLYYCVH